MKPLALTAVLLLGLSPCRAQDSPKFKSQTLQSLGGSAPGAPAAPVANASPASCGEEADFTPAPSSPANSQPSPGACVGWGQEKTEVLDSIYNKVVEASAKDDGFFKKLFSTKPKVETVTQYLPSDSPAVADNKADDDPHVSVGQSALDSMQSPDEMAGLVGHELWHTKRKLWEKACWNRGFHKARESRPSLPGSTFMEGKDCTECQKVKPFRRDLEREADCHGAKIAADAHFDAHGLLAALKHVKDLGEALGADASKDEDHDSFEQRDSDLKNCIDQKQLFDAQCPWGESD
jgi:hypothetical protein